MERVTGYRAKKVSASEISRGINWHHNKLFLGTSLVHIAVWSKVHIYRGWGCDDSDGLIMTCNHLFIPLRTARRKRTNDTSHRQSICVGVIFINKMSSFLPVVVRKTMSVWKAFVSFHSRKGWDHGRVPHVFGFQEIRSLPLVATLSFSRSHEWRIYCAGSHFKVSSGDDLQVSPILRVQPSFATSFPDVIKAKPLLFSNHRQVIKISKMWPRLLNKKRGYAISQKKWSI